MAAIAGFAIASGLATHLLPDRDLPDTVREKIAHLAQHGDEYDAIFLGSSRIQNHVIPALFDRLAADLGIPVKSFNFGISSMHFPEDDYVLDLILAQPHAHLRWVFLELGFFETPIQMDKARTLRGLYWHDWRRFSLLCRRLSVSRKKRGLRRKIEAVLDRWNDFVDHTLLFCERSASVGRGDEALVNWIFRTPSKPLNWSSLGESGDGWLPADVTDESIGYKRTGRLEKTLRKTIMEPPERDEDDAMSQNILASSLDRILDVGATPVMVIPPRAVKTYFYPRSATAARFPVIDLCDPTRFPELYKEDIRVDASHLNEAGAIIFTRLLANEFVKAIQKP